MKTIAIDPSSGKNNGVCIRVNNIIIEVKILEKLEVLKLIDSTGFDVLIVEDSRLLGTYKGRSKRSNGVLDAAIKDYQRAAKIKKIKFIPVRPCGLNKIANTAFPPEYSEYKNRTEHEKVAILLHDCCNLSNIKKRK